MRQRAALQLPSTDLPAAKPAAKLIDLAGGIEDLLLARIERMALRAYLDVKLFALIGRARLKIVTTATLHRDFVVIGMYAGLHRISPRTLNKHFMIRNSQGCGKLR
jgi:hypothetical protein